MHLQSHPLTTHCTIDCALPVSLNGRTKDVQNVLETFDTNLLPNITLDRDCDLPLYVQLFETIAWHIECGHLGANSKLPSVRRLANDLGISTETVCKAMDLLLSNGFIETRYRRNATVSTNWSERQQYFLPGSPQVAVQQPIT